MPKKRRLDQIRIKSLVTDVRGGNRAERTKLGCPATQIWQECSWICPTNLPDDC